jgi:hypothetical protein
MLDAVLILYLILALSLAAVLGAAVACYRLVRRHMQAVHREPHPPPQNRGSRPGITPQAGES